MRHAVKVVMMAHLLALGCGASEPNSEGGGDLNAPAQMFVSRLRTPDSRTNYVSVLGNGFS